MGKFFFQQISLRHSPGYLTKGKWLPPCDVFETETAFVIVMELAGLQIEDLSMSIDHNKLLITGTRDEVTEQGVETYYQVEINYGPFERVIILPENTDSSGLTAEIDAGFLTITLPRTDQPS
jgi:HSP20 family protein